MINRFYIPCLLIFAVWPLGLAVAGEIPNAETPSDAPAKTAKAAGVGGLVTPLLEQLDHDSFDIRQEALAKLEELVARDDLKLELAAELNVALLRTDISFEVRFHLQRWCGKLPYNRPKPQAEVSEAEFRRLVTQLDDDCYGVRTGADCRLRWLLCRDEHVKPVKSIIGEQLAAAPDLAMRQRLQSVFDFARPAMVAEYWQGRRCQNRQHLLIGVPSFTLGAPRPSHFDRIDDKVAHCVSGSNLSEGDYPVGVAFPHPSRTDSFFHLVNLATPRRKLAYQRPPKKVSDTMRLAEISRRTLDRILQQERAFDEKEIAMLGQLSQAEVSRFAGEYFNQIEDEQLPSEGISYATGRGSRHAAICELLAREGTKDAMPRLLEAIDTNRFLPPTSKAPYQVSWLAALAIAQRDPWAEVDDWLVGLIGRTDQLIEGRTQGPLLGATAAAVLLQRHKQNPRTLGLRPIRDTFAQRCRLVVYMYPSPKASEAVLKWWKAKEAKNAISDPLPLILTIPVPSR